jgi:hypothetical protein
MARSRTQYGLSAASDSTAPSRIELSQLGRSVATNGLQQSVTTRSPAASLELGPDTRHDSLASAQPFGGSVQFRIHHRKVRQARLLVISPEIDRYLISATQVTALANSPDPAIIFERTGTQCPLARDLRYAAIYVIPSSPTPAAQRAAVPGARSRLLRATNDSSSPDQD